MKKMQKVMTLFMASEPTSILQENREYGTQLAINFVRNFVALGLAGATDFDGFIGTVSAGDMSLNNYINLLIYN